MSSDGDVIRVKASDTVECRLFSNPNVDINVVYIRLKLKCQI